MLKVIFAIYDFIRTVWTIVETVWFAIHGVIRFVFRMVDALALLLQSLPVWLLPAALICLTVGLGLVLVGRN